MFFKFISKSSLDTSLSMQIMTISDILYLINLIMIFFLILVQASKWLSNVMLLLFILHCFVVWSFRLLPQGTVDNNLGPDRFAGPKALDPYWCWQPTLWLHDLCLEVLTVHSTKLRLWHSPLTILLMSRIWHSSRRYTFWHL